jgi:hypothetical protein
MKKLLVILLVFLPCWCWAASAVKTYNGVADSSVKTLVGVATASAKTANGVDYNDGDSAGPVCSGDWSDGQNESFEKGAGEYCTTDWSTTDNSSTVNPYSTSWYNCGSHSLAVIMDSDNGQHADFAGADITADGDFYIRFYFKYDVGADYTSHWPLSMKGPNSWDWGVAVKARNAGGGDLRLNLRNTVSDSDSATYFALSDDGEYRVEIHYVQNNTTTMKLFTKAGSVVYNNTGSPNDTVTITAPDQAMRYFRLGSFTDDSAAKTMYFDDIKIGLSAADYLGAASCTE